MPGDIQGESRAAAVRGETIDGAESVFLQVLGPGWPSREQWLGLWRGVRTRDRVYARWHDQGGRRLLFDLRQDHAEMKNLVDDPAHASTVAEMEDRLQDWLRRTGDPFDTGRRLPVTGMLDLGQAFITSEWLARAPAEYARAIAENHKAYRTGEQPGDPTPVLLG